MSPLRIMRSFGENPPATIALEQLVRRARTPSASRVVGKVPRRQAAPHVQNRGDDPPGGLDHILAMEERGIASHAVVEEPLVTGGFRLLAEVLVAELQLDCLQSNRRSGQFGRHLNADTLVRLHMDDQPVALNVLDAGLAEEHQWRAIELDDDLRISPGPPLPRAQIEGNAGPAPVIDEELQC